MAPKTANRIILAIVICMFFAEIPGTSAFNSFRLGKAKAPGKPAIEAVHDKCMSSVEIYLHNKTNIDCFPDENASKLFHLIAGKDTIEYSWQLPRSLPIEKTSQNGHELIISSPTASHSGPFTCSSEVSYGNVYEGDPRKKTFMKHVLFVESPMLTSTGIYSIHLERCGVEPQTMQEISDQFRKILCDGIEDCTRDVTSTCAGDKLMLEISGMKFKMFSTLSCDYACKLKESNALVYDDMQFMRKKIEANRFSEKLQLEQDITPKSMCPPGSVLLKNRCLPCPPGSFSLTSNACTLCPPGQWESTYGSTQCKHCTKDWSLSYRGAKSIDECSSTFKGQPKFTPNSCAYYEVGHLAKGLFATGKTLKT